MENKIQDFKYDWGYVITEFILKKDLDSGDWADCWSEDYNWTEFDLYLIGSYFDELVGFGINMFNISITQSRNDLRMYEKHYGG